MSHLKRAVVPALLVFTPLAACLVSTESGAPAGLDDASAGTQPHSQDYATTSSERGPLPGVGIVSIVSPPIQSADDVPGFVLQQRDSRFLPAADATTTADGAGITRILSTNSVYARFPNGFSAVRPLVLDSQPAPLTEDEAAHNAETRQYFYGAGLPGDQIGDMRANTIIDVSGRVGESGRRTFRGFVSVVRRAVAATRVEGSYAWAQFGQGGALVAESVWWPPLPRAIIEQVVVAKKQLAEQPNEFRSKLPDRFRSADGEVVIHHAGPIEAAWYAAVTIDFQDGPMVARFSVDGTPVSFLPPQTPDSPKN